MRIMKLLGVLCVLLSSQLGFACLEFREAEINNAGVYSLSYIDAIARLKEGLDKLDDVKSGDTGIGQIRATIQMESKFECALDIIKPYTKSKIFQISESANGFYKSISLIKKLSVSQREILKKIMTTKSENKLLALTEQREQGFTIINDTWDMFLASTTLLSYAGFDEKLPSGHLRISQEHKKEALESLKTIYGDSLEKEKQTTKADFAAQLIYQHLNKDWQSADENWPSLKKKDVKKSKAVKKDNNSKKSAVAKNED